MNTSLHQASEQWVGLINGELACHMGMIQFPMRKGWKRGHRLVVLPDYQGIGLGSRFQDFVCKHYSDEGWNVNTTTSTPALVSSMRRNKNWKLVRFGRVKNTLSKNLKKYYNRSEDKGIGSSSKRITYSFVFNNQEEDKKT